MAVDRELMQLRMVAEMESKWTTTRVRSMEGDVVVDHASRLVAMGCIRESFSVEVVASMVASMVAQRPRVLWPQRGIHVNHKRN